MSDEELRRNVAEWYSAGQPVDRRAAGECLVRVWQPGDGIACYAAGYQKKQPCPAPVAVVKDIFLERSGYAGRQRVTRVVCIRHLSEVFGATAVPVQEQDTERAALEELATRHWDEYQIIRVSQREQLLRNRLSALPEELREQVIAAMEADESGGAS